MLYFIAGIILFVLLAILYRYEWIKALGLIQIMLREQNHFEKNKEWTKKYKGLTTEELTSRVIEEANSRNVIKTFVIHIFDETFC